MISEFLLEACDGAETQLVHLTMRLAGLTRAKSIIRAFYEYREQDNALSASMIYLLPYSTDLKTIKDVTSKDTSTEMRNVTSRMGPNSVFFDTYDSWTATGAKLSDSPLRIVVMDLGCDQEYAGAALAFNALLRGVRHDRQGGDSKTCILTLSASASPPFDPELVSRHLPGLVPRHELVEYSPVPVQKDQDSQNWPYRAKEEIQMIGATAQTPQYDGPHAVICFMSWADFAQLNASLRSEDRHALLTVPIKPWVPGASLAPLNYVPSKSQPKIRLVHMGHDANFLPQIRNIGGVIIGPTVDDFVFDRVISCVVEAEVPLPSRVLGLAQAVAQCTESDEDIVIQQYAMQKPGRTPLAPSIERDLLYLVMSLVRDDPSTSLDNLPVRFPHDDVDCESMLREAMRRLRLWGLITTQPGQRKLLTTRPLGRSAGECMRYETNIHAAVLLGCVEASMPSRTKKAMIQLAMLISHGPTEIFLSTLQDTEARKATLKEAGFPQDLCDRGGLWLALCWLRALEIPRAQRPQGKGLVTGTNVAASSQVQTRVREWMGRLPVEGRDDADALLTREDVLVIDKAIVRCFIFNCMLLTEGGEHRQQYARDITSQIILQPRDGVTGEVIDWADRPTDTGPDLYGVYTHLKRTTREDGRYEYTPVNPTAIPFQAMRAVMAEVCPEGLQRLCPSSRIPHWYKAFRNDERSVPAQRPGEGEREKGGKRSSTATAGTGAVLNIEQHAPMRITDAYEIDWAWQDGVNPWGQHMKYKFTR